VHAIIDDVDSQPRWRKDVVAVTRVSATSFVERDQRGAETTFVRLPSSPDEVALTFEGQGFSGRFLARVTEVREGTSRSSVLVLEETVQMQGAVAAVMASLFFDLDAFVRQWSADVGAEAERRASRRDERALATSRTARAAPKIVWVARRPIDGVERLGQHEQLWHIGACKGDGARLLGEGHQQGSLLRRSLSQAAARAAGALEARHANLLLDGEGKPMQRPAELALGALEVARFGLGEGTPTRDVDPEKVELGVLHEAAAACIAQASRARP
jgi:hypothetical protein